MIVSVVVVGVRSSGRDARFIGDGVVGEDARVVSEDGAGSALPVQL